MSVVNPPLWMTGESHPGATLRRATAALLGGRPGTLSPMQLLVTAHSPANMSVDVSEGFAAVKGTEGTFQGLYLAETRGTTNVVIAPADTSPRYDLVVARVWDDEYATGPNSEWGLAVIKGTPSGSPVAPAVPDNCLVLAQVYVGASVTSITAGNVSDRRANWSSAQYGFAAAAGGTIVCTSGTRPPSPVMGMRIYEIDSGLELVYAASGAWVVPYPIGRVAHATLSTNSSNFTGMIYPLSVAGTLLPNRRIRVHVHANVYCATANTTITVAITNVSNAVLNQAWRITSTAGSNEQVSVELLTTSGAGGTITYKIGASANVSSIITASPTGMTYLSLYDEGPV